MHFHQMTGYSVIFGALESVESEMDETDAAAIECASEAAAYLRSSPTRAAPPIEDSCIEP